MKKLISLLMCLLMTASVCIGCNNAPPTPPDPDRPSPVEPDKPTGEFRFEMNTTSCELEAFAQYELDYVLENSTEGVSWSSDDKTVADVKNGVVTGVGEGQTVIKGTAGGVTHSCTVNVVKATETPVLRVNKTSVASLRTLESVDFEAYLTYKEYALEADVELSSENDEIVKTEGMRATGVKPGSANVIVSALYLGAEYKKEIPVVVDLSVDLVRDKSSVDLYLYPQNAAQKKTDNISVKVYVNKQLRDGSTVTFKSSDEAVATVTADGVVTAAGVGETTIVIGTVVDGQSYETSTVVRVQMETIDTGRKVIIDYVGETADCNMPIADFAEIDPSKIKAVEYNGKVVSEQSGGKPVIGADGIKMSTVFVKDIVKNKRYSLDISVGEIYYRFYAVFAFKYDMYVIKGRDRLIANDGTSMPAGHEGPVEKSNAPGVGSVYKLNGKKSGDLGWDLNTSVYGFPCISRVDDKVDPNNTPYMWRSVKVYFPSDFTGIFHVRSCHHQIKYDNDSGRTIVFTLTWTEDPYNHEKDTCFRIYDDEGNLVNDGHTRFGKVQAKRWYTFEFDLTHRLWFDEWYEDCYWRVCSDTTYYMKDVIAYDDAYRTNVLGR